MTKRINYLNRDFENYTSLNNPLNKILENVKAVELLDLLEWKNPTIKLPNAKKHCKYKMNWTHDSNEYVILINEIKDFICKGHLSEYLKKSN